MTLYQDVAGSYAVRVYRVTEGQSYIEEAYIPETIARIQYVEARETAIRGDVDKKADKTALQETNEALAAVKQIVDNFFAEDATIEGAIDTLKEIANYIANDTTGAANIAGRVAVLEGTETDTAESNSIIGAKKYTDTKDATLKSEIEEMLSWGTF